MGAFDDLPSKQGGAFDDLPQATATPGPLEDVTGALAQPDYADMYGGPSGPELNQIGAQNSPEWANNAAGAVIDTAKGLPGFAAQLPGYAYKGARIATGAGGPQDQTKAIMEAFSEAVPQGQAMAHGLQSEPGSREFDTAAIQALLMAAPGLELVKGVKPKVSLETPVLLRSKIKQISETPTGEAIPAPTSPASASEPVPGVETAKVAQSATDELPRSRLDLINKILSDQTEAGRRALGQPDIEIPPPEKPIKPAYTATDTFGTEETPIASSVLGDLGGIMSKSGAKKAGKLADNSDLWDGAPSLSHPTHNKIYKPGGMMPDEAAQALYSAGYIPDPYVDTMWQELGKESQSSRNILKSRRSEAIAGAQEMAQAEASNITDVNAELARNAEAATFRPQDEPRPLDTATTGTMGESTGQQPAVPEPPVSVAGAGEPGAGGEGGVSTKNEYTDAQRAERGFPEAVKEARRDFGTVWDEAEATYQRDPGAGTRLVESINDGKTRAVSDADNALLLREQISAQGEHTDAVSAVNDAKTDADRTAAKARLVVARDRLQSVYEADRKAGRSTAQGLNARKMLAAEDYSLAQMEARARAANDGKPLGEKRLNDIQSLHDRIAELSDRVDQLQQSRGGFGKVAREGSWEARLAAKSGKRFTDFMDEQANKARERLIAKRGRLNAGIDPTNLVDEAIIGASHIAKGLTKFSDWSTQMVKDFGDRVKPYLADLWKRARAYHDASSKAYRSPEEVRLEQSKTRMAKDAVGYTAKIERGDFTKPQKQPIALDPAAFKMRANLERLKNEFERGVAKDAYKRMSPADKFWQHFVGIERAGKLSSPAVFEKLGLAAVVREVLSPVESVGGYAASKVFPRLTKGTRYGADLQTLTRAEIKAKASIFTQGMKDALDNVKGKETELEAMSDKYGRQPDFWYNRIGKIHAAIKAPVKRAEFTRSLEHRMDAAVKVGEDINHPEVMDRLATESALDANRAIFQQNTVVSKFFSMLDKAHPAAGRTARFLFPVVKIPVNLFKELVTYNVGAPVAAVKIGRAYWKGVETLEPAAREAIVRQLVKGSVGSAAILWGYYNSDKVHNFFKSMPPLFQHTPVAMAIHEGSLIKALEDQGVGKKFHPTEAWKDTSRMARYDIPFAYTVTGLVDALDPSNPSGWRDYLYGMIQSSTVPQAVSWTAKELDKPTPFSMTDRTRFRPPQSVWQSVMQGIPGLREEVPVKSYKNKP